ncbi:MAG: response regulator [Candidatus Omnitrophica bacterium]|nr:response regulator [Candidatus Omnitrophota bacterium]
MPNILIIDDNHYFQAALGMALARPGYAIRCASSAAAGMEIIAAWPVDLVITDYEMEDMDGIEAITRIRNNYTNNIVGARFPRPEPTKENQEPVKTPTQMQGNTAPLRKPFIILMSSAMNRELEARALSLGANGCLQKPFDLEELWGMIRESGI